MYTSDVNGKIATPVPVFLPSDKNGNVSDKTLLSYTNRNVYIIMWLNKTLESHGASTGVNFIFMQNCFRFERSTLIVVFKKVSKVNETKATKYAKHGYQEHEK